MNAVWVAIITAIIGPVILFFLQLWRERRNKPLRDMDMRMRRLEILMNINHNPEDDGTILMLYDEYHKNGGNSYIQARVKQWQNEQKQRAKSRGKKSGH